jgi:hypothetical protein
MTRIRVALATLLAVAAILAVSPGKAAARSCPLPEWCMEIDGWCTCEGYYCAGRYYCAIPHEL